MRCTVAKKFPKKIVIEKGLPQLLGSWGFLCLKADLSVDGGNLLSGVLLHKNHQTYQSYANNIGDSAEDALQSSLWLRMYSCFCR